ncbi:transcription antitermination factor NusB [Candidatus Parcubacteria bacterium]|nr:MAG: transcription antitermination factor NusB [Candidatus Parcubacteria bacterium]
MANRHLSRSVAMQTLFERDFVQEADSKIDSIIQRNIEQFAPGLDDVSFVQDLVRGVIGKQKKIDSIIEKAAPEWPIDQIAAVDRNVLRIGLFELLFGNKKEVPYKVAINEAIELAKSFGGDSSGKFVNGVLGTVYRELGVEEEDIGEEKKDKPPIEEKLSGAVVYRKGDKGLEFALVHDVFGYWTLSKGRIEGGESEAEGAKREIKEEIGLDVSIGQEIGKNEYIASDPEKGKVKKSVTYFLASAENGDIKLKKTGGLDEAKWFQMQDLVDLKIYDDIRGILAEAIKTLKKK